MVKRMLVDATHPEETRVVVVDGTKLDEFDFEAASRKPLKGNIYLAKVVRIEPSLQAAFVEYGGNRHGFLAFNEIHPDYYQIPIADRERLLAEQAQRGQRHDDDEDRPPRRQRRVDRSDIEDADEQRALLAGSAPASEAPDATDANLPETSGTDVGIAAEPDAAAPSSDAEPALIEAAPAHEPALEPAPEPAQEPTSGAIAASVTTDVISGPAVEDDKPAEAPPETIDANAGGDTVETVLD